MHFSGSKKVWLAVLALPFVIALIAYILLFSPLVQGVFASSERNDHLQLKRSTALIRQDRLTEALQMLTTLQQKYPNEPAIYNNLAAIALKNGDVDKAIQFLDESFKTNGTYSRIQENLVATTRYKNNLLYGSVLNPSSKPKPPKISLIDSFVTAKASGFEQLEKPAQAQASNRSHSNRLAKPVIEQARSSSGLPSSATSSKGKQASATASKPVSRPVSKPASKPKPKPASKPISPSEKIFKEELARQMSLWAEAWSLGKFDAYIHFYSKHFRSSKGSYQKWYRDRKRLVNPSKSIQVTVNDLRVLSHNKKKARIGFYQIYRSRSIQSSRIYKHISLVREGDRWLIVAESGR